MHANIQSKTTELGQVARNAGDAQREECKEIFGGAEAMRDGQRSPNGINARRSRCVAEPVTAKNEGKVA